MNDSQSFEKFIQWYTGLTNPSEMKRFISIFADKNFYQYKITDDFSVIKYHYRDISTGEHEELEKNMDLHLYSRAYFYFGYPTVNILPQMAADRIDITIASLRIAYKSATENIFFNSFTKYKNGITNLGQQLSEIKESFNGPLKVASKWDSEYGNKTQNVFKLKTDLKLIHKSGSHQEAIDALIEKYPDFKWIEPRELFKVNGDPNKSQISKVLHHVADLKFEDDIPSAETIRDVLLK
jgi:hypothetical protein